MVRSHSVTLLNNSSVVELETVSKKNSDSLCDAKNVVEV